MEPRSSNLSACTSSIIRTVVSAQVVISAHWVSIMYQSLALTCRSFKPCLTDSVTECMTPQTRPSSFLQNGGRTSLTALIRLESPLPDIDKGQTAAQIFAPNIGHFHAVNVNTCTACAIQSMSDGFMSTRCVPRR